MRVGEGQDARLAEGEQSHEAEGVRQSDQAVGPHLGRVRIRVRVKARVRARARARARVMGYGLGLGFGLGAVGPHLASQHALLLALLAQTEVVEPLPLQAP